MSGRGVDSSERWWDAISPECRWSLGLGSRWWMLPVCKLVGLAPGGRCEGRSFGEETDESNLFKIAFRLVD